MHPHIGSSQPVLRWVTTTQLSPNLGCACARARALHVRQKQRKRFQRTKTLPVHGVEKCLERLEGRAVPPEAQTLHEGLQNKQPLCGSRTISCHASTLTRLLHKTHLSAPKSNVKTSVRRVLLFLAFEAFVPENGQIFRCVLLT